MLMCENSCGWIIQRICAHVEVQMKLIWMKNPKDVCTCWCVNEIVMDEWSKRFVHMLMCKWNSYGWIIQKICAHVDVQMK